MRKPEITLLTEGFHYNGQFHHYSSVVHIGWYAIRTKVSMNYFPAGSCWDAWLEIHLKEQSKPLNLKVGAWFFATLRNTQAMCEALFQLYRDLSERTFQFRLQAYLNQLQTSGFFVYSGYKFYSNGDIVNDKNGKVLFNFRKDDLYSTANPFQLCIRPHTEGFLGGLKSRFGARRIDLELDKDIFCSLLYAVYGLKFD